MALFGSFSCTAYTFAAAALFCLSATISLAQLNSEAQRVQQSNPSPSTNSPSSSQRIAFEVATVKPVDQAKISRVEVRVYPGGQLVLRNQSFLELVMEAFNLSYFQVVNGDKWLSGKTFDIQGLPSEEIRGRIAGGEYQTSGLQNINEQTMLQSLLVDRFHLKFHMEKLPGTIYLLQRTDAPLKLQPAEINLYITSSEGSVKPSQSYPTGDLGLASGRPVAFHQTSMAQLADFLSSTEKTPVIDKTSLTGYYNFQSKTIVTDDDFKTGAVFQMIREAVPEMGLKLIKTQGEVEKLIIDGAEPPTAN